MMDLKFGFEHTADLLILPRLHERDIDVVLQEELIFNRAVRDLFGKALKLSGFDIHRCALSVSDTSGETDVFAFFSCDNGPGVLLIENKIDAAFLPRQPERYQERAQALTSRLPGHKAFCVLVAPERYLGGEQALQTADRLLGYYYANPAAFVKRL